MAGFHSLKDTLTFAYAAAPVVITDNTAMVSAIADLQGQESVTWVIVTGTLADADATFAVLVEHDDASNLGTAAAAPDETLDPLEAAASFTFALDNGVRSISYTPGRGAGKRYARLTVTPAANTGNAPLAAIAIFKPLSYGA